MAEFNTFDLGRVFQTGEAIKSLKRQEGDDLLRRQFMQTQLGGMQQQQAQQAKAFEAETQTREAKRNYLELTTILRSGNPHETAKMYAPELVSKIEQAQGAGAFDKIPADQLKQMLSAQQGMAAARAGIQRKIRYEDAGGQKVAIDEDTGMPVVDVASIQKTASPDSMLSAQTSMRGQDLSAATARRGQDIGAVTATRGQDVTLRGQDLASQTAAAGRATTERGQNLTYQAQQQKQAKNNPTAAWNTYNTAINQFKRDLGDTWYLGPGYEAVGQMLPDMTPARRVASGSRSNMAPVLKDVFRQAGEGTFTKDDQEVLLRMLPGISDSPGARKAKFENLDAIVRSKLGVNNPQGGAPPVPQPGMVQDGYVYKGGDPSSPQSWQKQ